MSEPKNRVEEALRIREMKQVELSEKTGIKKASINGWIKQRYQPKQKALVLMGKVLEVSEMWLAGYDVPMERPPEQIKIDELAELIHQLRKNEEFKNLCMSISKLNDTQLSIIKNMLHEFNKINVQQ